MQNVEFSSQKPEFRINNAIGFSIVIASEAKQSLSFSNPYDSSNKSHHILLIKQPLATAIN